MSLFAMLLNSLSDRSAGLPTCPSLDVQQLTLTPLYPFMGTTSSLGSMASCSMVPHASLPSTSC